MKRILLIHGPNLNVLGRRSEIHYGHITLAELDLLTQKEAEARGYDVTTFQSNHEGALIDWLQQEASAAHGIMINPGALTHYSYALHDAIVDTHLPCVEVHLSKIEEREEWRQVSVIAPACIAQVSGQKEQGYIEALSLLIEEIEKRNL